MAGEKVGSIYWDVDLDDSKLKKGAAGVEGAIGNLQAKFKEAEQGSFLLLGTITALGLGLAGMASNAIQTAGDLETMELGFKTLLGSTEEAEAAIAMIKKDAASTPFELPGLIQANQLLTSITKDAGRSEKFLLDIGKSLAAMGKGQPELDRIIVNLQQIGAIGKASMMDIKQFAFAGIPIFELLQEHTGLAGDALEDYISEGRVTFDELEGLFAKASGEGGRFANAFTDQAGSFNQTLSNMKDNLVVFGATLVEQTGLFDFAKDAMAAFNTFMGDLTIQMQEAGGASEYFNKKFEENKDLIYLLAGALLGALLPAFVSMGIAIWGALAPLLPFIAIGGLVALAIGTIVDAMGGWDKVLGEVKASFDSLMKLIQPAVDEILPKIELAFNTIKLFFSQLFNYNDDVAEVSENFKGMIPDELIMRVSQITQGITDFFAKVQAYINSPGFQQFLGALRDMANNILVNLQNGWTTLQKVWDEKIAPSLQKLKDALQPLIDQVLPIINQGLQDLIKFFFGAGEASTNQLSPAIEFLGSVLQFVIDIITGLVQIVGKVIEFWIWFGDIVGQVINGAWAELQNFWNELNRIFNDIKAWIQESLDKWTAFKDGIANAMSTAADAIKRPFEEVFNWLRDRVNEARETLDKLNPFHRESPSLVDWISRGTDKITSLYDGMFVDLNNMALQNRVVMTGTTQALGAQGGDAPVAQPPINMMIAPNGIIARSRSDLREIAVDLINAAEEEVKSRGLKIYGN